MHPSFSTRDHPAFCLAILPVRGSNEDLSSPSDISWRALLTRWVPTSGQKGVIRRSEMAALGQKYRSSIHQSVPAAT